MAVGEWDRRELCPDGGCVGVIGPDGHCKVCKRAVTNWGNERERGLKNEDKSEADDELEDEDEELEDEVDADDEDDDESEDDEGDDEDDDDDDEDDDEDGDYEDDEDDGAMDALDPSAPAAIGGAAVWNERQLCPDGGCIGLLGEDGLCKVCGKGKKRSVKAAPAAKAAAPAKPEPTTNSEEDSELAAAADDLAASLVEDRKLCPDGACVGVIGSNGTCTICGKGAA